MYRAFYEAVYFSKYRELPHAYKCISTVKKENNRISRNSVRKTKPLFNVMNGPLWVTLKFASLVFTFFQFCSL